MPLSEHEQRLLEQMERALYAEDPKFATSMRNPSTVSGDRRRIAVGVLAFLVGIGLLLGGVATQLVVMGVVGFLAMLGGLWLVVSAFRPRANAAAPTAGNPGAPANAPRNIGTARSKRRSSGSLAERMEERWRRRRETGDF
jgi:hypothetical protein